jgi:hypothetical protein
MYKIKIKGGKGIKGSQNEKPKMGLDRLHKKEAQAKEK